jgi:hypothetical protein
LCLKALKDYARGVLVDLSIFPEHFRRGHWSGVRRLHAQSATNFRSDNGSERGIFKTLGSQLFEGGLKNRFRSSGKGWTSRVLNWRRVASRLIYGVNLVAVLGVTWWFRQLLAP